MNGRRDISDLSSLSVWYLGDPAVPRKVGTVSLVPPGQRCSFLYADEWRQDGFPLSPDMKLGRVGDRAPIFPAAGWRSPGALEDAMPDRWAERTIRVLDRPKRVTPLDLLYYAGDRRFGALGISSEPEVYAPYPENPILTLSSLEEANALIQRIVARRPLNQRERRLMHSGRSLGGAQPKALVAIGDEEWIVKFPTDKSVDYPLVEHAAMTLARRCGIDAVKSRTEDIGYEHVVLTRRFDRAGTRRVHALSARTMLMSPGGESYAAIADAIRAQASSDSIDGQRREIFARMVFNILCDNTDDHAKNHAFLRGDDGHYKLSPAFDIAPQMSGLSLQAIPVADGERNFDLDAAGRNAARFGLDGKKATALWGSIGKGVSRWKDLYREVGVLDMDIATLSTYLDSEEKQELRASTPGRRPERAGDQR